VLRVAGISRPVFGPGLVVSRADDVTAPAFISGIRRSDVIVKINSVKILSSETAVTDFIRVIRSNPETPVTIELVRNGERDCDDDDDDDD